MAKSETNFVFLFCFFIKFHASQFSHSEHGKYFNVEIWQVTIVQGCTKYKMYTNCQKDTVLITKFLSHFLFNSKNFIHHCFFSNSDHFATLTLILDSGSNETKFERVDRVGNCDRVIMEYTITNYVIYCPMYKLYTPPSEYPCMGTKNWQMFSG